MMAITVDDRWRIEPDAHGWILVETRPGMTRPKGGGEPQPTTTETRYYYGHLLHAARAIINEKPTDACANVHDLIAAIERQTDRIVAAIGGAS